MKVKAMKTENHKAHYKQFLKNWWEQHWSSFVCLFVLMEPHVLTGTSSQKWQKVALGITRNFYCKTRA